MSRSPPWGAFYALAVGMWLAFRPSEARADDPVSRLHLSYEVPSGCPSRREFVASLSPRIQATWVDGSDTRSFEVRVVRGADGTFAGQLVIRQPGRAPNTREIRGGACKAVTMSLVVFVAIALDPASEPPAQDEASKAGETEPTRSPDRAESQVGIASEPPEERPPPRRKPRRPAPSPRAVWTWSAGVAASHTRLGEASWGGRVHAEISRAHERDPLAPALRLSWGWSDFSTTPEQAGEVRFRLRSARLEAGVRSTFAPFFVGAFVGFDLGSLTGVAADLPRFEEVSAPWTAWTGAARAGLTLAPWLALELAATVLVPFERPRFDLRDPVRVAYAAPAVVFEGGAGVVAVARFR